MPRPTAIGICLLALAAFGSVGPSAVAQQTSAASRAGVVIGDLAWTSGVVSRAEPTVQQAWKPVGRGDKLRTGDTLRTGDDGVATITFPWMEVSLGTATALTIPATAVLSTVLEQGRAEVVGAGRDIVKIVVGESEIRGGGRLVIRRAGRQTTASVLKGTFRVRALGRLVEINAGQGILVRDGSPPSAPVSLPPAPGDLRPGAEVSYCRAGRPVTLNWVAAASGYVVQVLPLEEERVLLARETSDAPARLELPWLGTYRWRVSSRDARGLESPPSRDGLIAVVER